MDEVEVIKVNNPNVLLLEISHANKFVDICTKRDCEDDIDNDLEIQGIISKYKKKRYNIAICVSGNTDPREILTNIIEHQVDKLIKANARV